MKILLLFAKGYRCRDIAELLNRTEQSIRNAKTTLYRKCSVTSDHELIAYALSAKLINENELWSFHRPKNDIGHL
jgi:DNA-binding NarL/FixJ family response regulator